MNSDIVIWKKNGRKHKELIVFPDADISEPENESESDIEQHDTTETDSTTDSEDEIPLALLDDRPLANYSVVSKGPYKWQKKAPQIPDVTFVKVISHPPEEEINPINYFRMFFTADMFDLIVVQSNRYAIQANSNFRIDRDELEKYFKIILKLGIVIMPRYDMYWCTETRFLPIADVMSRDRLKEITRFLHFNDNTQLK